MQMITSGYGSGSSSNEKSLYIDLSLIAAVSFRLYEFVSLDWNNLHDSQILV